MKSVGTVGFAVVSFALLFAAPPPASIGGSGEEAAKLLDEAREAAKAGDAAKVKELGGRALTASSGSMAVRAQLAALAESLKDVAVARDHYAEIVFAADQTAKRKEKLGEDDAKLVKEAAGKVKSLPDAYSKSLAKALKEYSNEALKIARLSKTKQHWLFAVEIGRTLKILYSGLPGVLDPKDPNAKEADKLVLDGLAKRAEDKPDVATSFRASLSEATATLSKALNEVADRELATYLEVRGPASRRRALAPLGILIGLKNDPDGHAKKAEDIWAKAYELEPSCDATLRFATDARSFYVRLNGRKVVESQGRVFERNYKETRVRLLRDANVLAVYGHEALERKGEQVRDEYAHRVWQLVDIVVTDKDHVVSDASWGSAMGVPNGWDQCPDTVIDFFPTSVFKGSYTVWSYEQTKTWKGDTIVGDITDTFLRKMFDVSSPGLDWKVRAWAPASPSTGDASKPASAPGKPASAPKN